MSGAASPPLPWDGQHYSVKRFGASISNCDSEPVHIPGCIQAHGVLMALRSDDLVVLQISDNCERWFGHAPQALLGQSVASLLGEETERVIVEAIAQSALDANPLYLLTLPASAPRPSLDLTLHTVERVAILELEPTRSTPDVDYYALVKRSIARLQRVPGLQALCETVAQEVRRLTGLDRVMVYRFHQDLHGEVVAESKAPELDSFLGLHYPKEDIPLPARQIFRQIWLRPVAEVGAELAELVPLANPDTGLPLNMTHCALRGPSVMYTEYLQNMGVTASLTLSIRRDGELWGLVACHHYSGPIQLPHQARAACEILAQVVSLQHQSAQHREDLTYRVQMDGVHNQLIVAATRERGLPALLDGTPSLLDAIDADGAALFHDGRWWCCGDTPSTVELDPLLVWLGTRPELTCLTRPLYASDSLVCDYPPAAAFAKVASGLLAVSLSRASNDVILWFRAEVVQSVRWAGDPDDKPSVPGSHGPRLTPRRSFELFLQSVRLRSLPWKEVELEAAGRLRLLIIELVVARGERLAALNSELTRSNEELDAFAYVASHDLKEPLRGVHNYAHQLLDHAAAANEEVRDKLGRLVRLTVRMDSLLDTLLHYSRVGQTELEMRTVSLEEVVSDALEIVDPRRADRATHLVFPRPLPNLCCDRVRVREIFVNLLSNALKYNDSSPRVVEVGFVLPAEQDRLSRMPPEAHGRIVLYVRDNGIGIHAKHHSEVFTLFRRLHTHERYGGGTGAGLAIVKKLVSRHNGQVWIESTLGSGTTVFFTLSPPASRSEGPPHD